MISDLRKPDPAVRKAAAIALDSLAWTAATDEDRALFLAALARWDGLPPLGEAAIDALLLVLRTSHTSELESAISTLSVIDPLWTQRGAAGAAVPALTSALTSISSAAVTTTVAGALVRIDPGWTRSAEARAVVPAMVSMLTSGRKIPLEQRTAIIAALGEIGDSRAVEALAAALNGQNALISPRAAESLANIRDSRAVEPLVRYLYAYPGSTDVVATAIRKLAPSSALSSHLAEYAVRAVGFRFRENSALASLDEAEAAVHALCSVDSPVTSNVLHLVAQLKDLSIAWNPNCLGDKYEVSRETLRNLAREELARRGNPPYRPEAYLRTECASGSSAPSPEHTQQPTTTL